MYVCAVVWPSKVGRSEIGLFIQQTLPDCPGCIGSGENAGAVDFEHGHGAGDISLPSRVGRGYFEMGWSEAPDLDLSNLELIARFQRMQYAFSVRKVENIQQR
ncbi:hypothetical protein E3G69_000049 [Mycobacteroides abscessus]|nr:hypothetical protein [Mycobacteroides abscessus]QOF41039.1 hypothetical protein E3G69_000049 [Mycobacteroides abscessus]SIJ33040.1 Uncharacterised protein [Mycobacteroides abscessus subsp. bolletii]